jgi:hypothetical protein
VDHAHGATMSKFYTREDVLRKFYRNMRFSFKTCFGWRGRLLVRPVFEIACFGQSLLQLLKGKGMALRAHVWAWHEMLKLGSGTKEARTKIQGMRTISDRQLFKIVMRRYTWRELLSVVRGNT